MPNKTEEKCIVGADIMEEIEEQTVLLTTETSFKNKNSTHFYKDAMLMKVANEIEKKGSLTAVTKYGTYPIKTKSDRKSNIISGICQLGNYRLLLADCDNSTLKLVNEETFQIISTKTIDGFPKYVCAVGENEAAVSMKNEEICLFKADRKIALVGSFCIDKECSSIASDGKTIFVCFPDSISMYTRKGIKIKEIRPVWLDNPDQKFRFKHMAITSDKGILLTDVSHGIIEMDISGMVIRQMTDTLIKSPEYICMESSGKIYVTEKDSDCVFQIKTSISQEGETVIGRFSEKGHPNSMCLEKKNNRVVVGYWCEKDIQVFEQTQKKLLFETYKRKRDFEIVRSYKST